MATLTRMRRHEPRKAALLSPSCPFLVLLALILSARSCQASVSSSSLNALRSNRGLTFVVPRRHPIPIQHQSEVLVALSVRGGATAVDEDSDGDEDVKEDESDEGEEDTTAGKLDGSLSASAIKAAIKTKVKQEASKKAASKKTVSAQLLQMQTPTKKSTSSPLFRIPYIVRALLNPVTVFQMTVAYWASLFNLDYGKKDPALELRSALEEKAKSSGGGGATAATNRGKRKMKRGQAKSLSDLPQLSS